MRSRSRPPACFTPESSRARRCRLLPIVVPPTSTYNEHEDDAANFRREGTGLLSDGLSVRFSVSSGRRGQAQALAPRPGVSCVLRWTIEKTTGNKHQRGHQSRTDQAPDDSPSERRVLLAALAEAKRHRQPCRSPWPAPSSCTGRRRVETGFHRSGRSGSRPVLHSCSRAKLITSIAVGGGDAHAHDRAGQRRHRQCGSRCRNRIQTIPASAAGNAITITNGSSHDWKLTTISR